jgi:diguanylate cyclase (GGDEF)-like protein
MHKKEYSLVIRLLLLTMLLFSFSNANVVLTNSKSYYDDFKLSTYYDPNSKLDIKDIKKINFTEKTSNKFTYGYLNGTRWFKLTLHNRSDQKNFVINFDEALWEKLNMFYYEDGQYKEDLNGLIVPLNKRSIKDVNPSFEIYMDKNETKTLYFQGQTKASQIGYFKVFTQKEYFSPLKLKTTYIYIVFAITLLTIIILNIYKLVLTKEEIYFYYIIYISVFVVFTSLQSGWYLIFGFDGWSEGLHVVGTFVNISLICFTNRLLDLKNHLPKIYSFFRISIIVFLIFAVLIFNNIPNSELLFNLYSILFFTILFVTAWKVYTKGSIDAKNYLFALMIYTPLMSLMILNFNALLDYTYFTRHIYLLGSFIEIMFFTLILTYKYRALNIEKIKIQQKLIDEKQNNQKLLEEKIQERTKELQEAQKKLQKMATTDSLTQLYNRYKIDEVLKSQLQRSKRFAESFGVILIDVDDFKNVNDNYGHLVGDSILKSIAKTIKDNVREVDTVGRWGGEEFIILCPNTDLLGVKNLAEKIRQSIENLSLTPVKSQSASFGVCEFKQNDTIDSVIKKVDDALYEAKRTGKNCIVTC